MKKLILILLALSPLCLMAQNNDKLTPKDLPSSGAKAPLYILDGKKIDKTSMIGIISPADIEEVTILKDAKSTAEYGIEGANGVIIITTKKFAVAFYQDKISSLSDDYESYLTSHGKADAQFIYVVDGVPLAKDSTETGKLYSIAKGNIESAVFVQDQPEGSKILAKIVITTKK